jgi:hypothetical protein
MEEPGRSWPHVHGAEEPCAGSGQPPRLPCGAGDLLDPVAAAFRLALLCLFDLTF